MSDMISRSLGPEFGGAVGVTYYLSNVLGCGKFLDQFPAALLTTVISASFDCKCIWRDGIICSWHIGRSMVYLSVFMPPAHCGCFGYLDWCQYVVSALLLPE